MNRGNDNSYAIKMNQTILHNN